MLLLTVAKCYYNEGRRVQGDAADRMVGQQLRHCLAHDQFPRHWSVAHVTFASVIPTHYRLKTDLRSL